MSESDKHLSDDDRDILLDMARRSIITGLQTGQPADVVLDNYRESLGKKGAAFVTLHINSNLRGCIGSLEGRRPLIEDVSRNAFAAAFSDPRFHPLHASEYDKLDIHISVLTPSTPMQFRSESELLDQIRPGIDGLVLEDGLQRGTFLPSVWGALPDPRHFLDHLKQKAGLPVDYWSDTIKVYRYTTISFGKE